MTSTQTPPTATPITTPTDMSRDARCTSRLRTVLRLNAASSIASGAVMAALPHRVDDILDTGHPGWIRLVGVGLIVFALSVGFASTFDRRKLVATTPAIVAGDIAWVVASLVTVLLGWYSGGGIVAVLAVAAMVETFAVLQWSGLRHLR